MVQIKPAKFIDGKNRTIAQPNEASILSGQNNSRIINGKALIVWDENIPDKKMDAIDTDQITPSAYCVSESIDNIDDNWKNGAFKYLIPNFRQRVHDGETFLIVGDHFGIGSSREMSPAGLKAIAEEVGLELVIVCGNNPGDIFRRNALNLGLHVVQSKDAVRDTRDGDIFKFNVQTRELTNITQNKKHHVVKLNDKEGAVVNIGGVFELGRKDFLNTVSREPIINWPNSNLSKYMSITEQIIWSHRVNKADEVKPGAVLKVYADLFPASDGTAPFAIYTFNKITGGNKIYPRQAAIVNDHFVFTNKVSDKKQLEISKKFAEQYDIKFPYYASSGEGIFHLYFPENGLIHPGGIYVGADSHSRTYGAYGSIGIGVGSTALGLGWSTGYAYLTVPKSCRIIFYGKLSKWVTGKDVALYLLKRFGKHLLHNMSVEFIDKDMQLSMSYRHTIANMMSEAEVQNAIFVSDQITLDWYAKRNIELIYPKISSGKYAIYEFEEQFNLENIVPLVAKPFSPDNVFSSSEIAKAKISFSKAYIGSCTNGSYEDLLQAAQILFLAKEKGFNKIASNVTFVVFPGSALVKEQIEKKELGLNGYSVAEIIREFGGQIRQSWCGPCFGQGCDALKEDEKAITTFNRNWKNRMGFGSESFLASPVVLAASIIAGYICSPRELGL